MPRRRIDNLNRPRQSALADVWPVGSVFISILPTNPAGLLGFGSWQRIGKGKAIVGVDEADTDFDTPKETTGAKTKAISAHSGAAVANHASHTHTYTQVPNHVHTLATGTGASGNFSQVVGTVDTSSGGTGGTPTQTALGTLSGNPVNGVASGTTNGPDAILTHSVTQPDAHSDLNVVQPSIALYLWERLA